MNWEHITGEIARQPWVEPMAKTLQNAVASVYRVTGPAGNQLRNFLHGTWLGHPLHPALTDLPIGAWTVALGLDAVESFTGDERLSAGADASVAAGLAGALAAASAGLTDWHTLGGTPRRLGMVHALLNIAATVLYAISLILRRGGQRPAGRALGFAGFLAVTGGAYLGGQLVYSERVGVNHTAGEKQPKSYHAVVKDAELAEGTLHRADVDGTPVLLVRHEGWIYALADTCSHRGCSLAEYGRLEDGSIRCRCHGSRYALEDGRVLDGPSTYWQPTYAVRLRNGQIEVGKPENRNVTGG